MHCATSRTVPGSIPGGVTGDFFRSSLRRNHVPWGRLSPWKWVPGISPGVKAADAYDWRPTTLVVPNVKKMRGLNLPGTPWATSACYGRPLPFNLFSDYMLSFSYGASDLYFGKIPTTHTNFVLKYSLNECCRSFTKMGIQCKRPWVGYSEHNNERSFSLKSRYYSRFYLSKNNFVLWSNV